MHKLTDDRMKWGLCALLLGVALVGVGMLRPYWVAKYHGGGADLHGAFLVGAPLAFSDLRSADLGRANLHAAELCRTTLDKADLTLADLCRADLSNASLFHTQLQQAKLTDAVLANADLTWANLTGTDLHDADLTGVVLTSARYDCHTRWPSSFDPQRHGAVRER
jgi:uncharacterized protein YjbI with pentapeptide repeats